MKRTIAFLLVQFILTAGAAIPVAAQDFPSKPVRLVVPFPPGGPLDIGGRLLGKDLQELWKQPVIVENRVGGSGTIAVNSVVKSAPDGHTLLVISSTPLVTQPHLFHQVPYDVVKDLAPVIQTTLSTFALLTNPKTGITSVRELVERARKAPGVLNYASAGNGSGQHLLMELFKSAASVNLTHVPYKGAAPALQGLIAGEVDMMLEVAVAAVPLVKAGKAHALMVTGALPLEPLPGAVPFESLYPGLDIPTWHGIFTAAATPRPIIGKLAQDIRQVLLSPAISSRFRELGIEPSGVSGARFDDIVRLDYERWGEIIRKNNLRAD